MRQLLLGSAFLAWGLQPAWTQLRAPSCDALIAFVYGVRFNLIEISFGKPVDAMSDDDFTQAIDIVSVCMDEVEASPPDVPGLFPIEKRRTRMNALTVLTEDLGFYRSRQRERERERRAANYDGNR